MRIGVAASPEIALVTLNNLLASHHETALVISQPDRLSGRGRTLMPTPVSQWAIENELPLHRPSSPHELKGVVDNLDLVLTVGYGVLLPASVLSLPKFGFINLHFSLLPAYRGAAPAQRAIEAGESVTGVSVFALEPGMDTGPIYATASLLIKAHWRSKELLSELALLGPKVVDDTLSSIENNLKPTPQTGTPSLATKITKKEAEIDWTQGSEMILRKIRAFYSSPIAWSTFRNHPIKLTSAGPYNAELAPSQLTLIDGELVVGCGLGTALVLTSVIPAGKKEMSGADWLRGLRIEKGAYFGTSA